MPLVSTILGLVTTITLMLAVVVCGFYVRTRWRLRRRGERQPLAGGDHPNRPNDLRNDEN